MTTVSFCRSNRSVRTVARVKRAGFTLVELLVVIGVMAILVAMLMPALSKVRESARRAKCAANLKNMGAAAHSFAGLHGGRFPMCYRMRDTDSAQYPYYTPFVIAQADKLSDDSDPAMWTVFGTSWSAWQMAGESLQSLSCPSASRVAVAQDLTNTNPEWGSVIWSTYMYVGGLTSTITTQEPYQAKPYPKCSKQNWGTAPPAVTTFDTNLSETVLAADMVFYSGNTGPINMAGNSWDVAGRWMINHPSKDLVTMTPATAKASAVSGPIPDFQNILYGDGHVAAKQRADFPFALNTEANASYGASTPQAQQWNFSMVQADPSTGGVGGYMYWGEMNSILTYVPPLPNIPPVPGGGAGQTPPQLPANFLPPTPPPLYVPPTATGPSNPVPIPG
jgi:prepilin-type N-terminal cleavage/methylation domain-containing protein